MLNNNASGAETVISVRGMGLKYASSKNAVDALNDINLDINRGDFICVLGKSGCGKSTLLNILAGFLKPTSGSAEMLGKKINGPDWNRGVVFQMPTLFPWLSTYDNIAFGPKMRKLPKAEIKQQAKKYIDLVGLAGFEKNRPYELSGGMKQRAALARVLANEPQMILMDEPFGALDALTRVKMQDLVRGIWKKSGNTILMITHDVDEALLLATRIVILADRPGTITKSIDIDFTSAIDSGADDDIRYSKEYRDLRAEILGIINDAEQ